MKTLYTLLLSAIAGTAVGATFPAGHSPEYVGAVRCDGLQKTSLQKLKSQSSHQNINAKRAASADSEEIVITDAPGVEKIFFRNVEGFGLNFAGMPDIYTFGGIAQKMRFDGDDVYMYSPVSSYPTESWIKGSLTEDGMIFPLPQTIQRDFDDDPEWGYDIRYELNIFQLYDEGEGLWYDNMEDNRPNEIFLKKQEDGSYGYVPEMMTLYSEEYDEYYQMPKYIVAVTASWDPEFYIPEWMGYGDFYDNIKMIDQTPVVAPEGISFAPWTVVSEGAGHIAEVGFDKEDIYFKGLFPSMPEGVVKGSVADGKVSLPCGQYVGINEVDNVFCFFYAGVMEHWFDEDIWAQHFDIDIDKEAILEYDAANNKMTTDQGFVLFTSEEAFMSSDYLQTPTIMIQPEEISLIPSQPEILDYLEYGYWGDYCMVEFQTNNLDDDGYWLGPDSCFSYRIISDGTPVVFTPSDDYPFIEEEMEWIPYDFTDDFTFMNDPYLIGDYSDHIVSIHVESEEYTALQVRFVDPKDGKEYLAEPEVFWGVQTSVSGIGTEASEAEYFNLQGMRIYRPEGLCIIKKGEKASLKIVK